MQLKHFFPLCFITNDVLLLYKYGYLYTYNIVKQKILMQRKAVFLKKETMLARINPAFRAMRLGARLGTYIGNDIALLVIGKKIYEVNTRTLDISMGFTNSYSRPLNFGLANNVKGFDNGVYWGDYMGNTIKNGVSIYKRISKDQWASIYTFPQGEVNHVHNVVPDSYHDCFWIFTGDFGNASAIWKATENFSNVEPILRGNQLYRGCVVFPMPEKLLYITDSPFEQNYIMSIEIKGNKYKIKKMQDINGSCIYGIKLNEDTFVFQSSVEPDGRNESMMGFLFSRKRGSGIKNKYVYLYSGNPKDGFNVIYKASKDPWPYSLFQFGTFQFPDNNFVSFHEGNTKSILDKKTQLLPFYSMAVKKHNMETQFIKIK